MTTRRLDDATTVLLLLDAGRLAGDVLTFADDIRAVLARLPAGEIRPLVDRCDRADLAALEVVLDDRTDDD